MREEQSAYEGRSGGQNIAGQDSGTTVSDREGKYLTFELANEIYGLEILKVREIIGMLDITPVPQTPKFVKGLINLRGKVIPVVDLRLKFGLPEKEYTERTAIINFQLSTIIYMYEPWFYSIE